MKNESTIIDPKKFFVNAVNIFWNEFGYRIHSQVGVSGKINKKEMIIIDKYREKIEEIVDELNKELQK